MELTKVNFIVKGEVICEYINLNFVQRFMWIDGVPYVGMVGQTFTKQVAEDSESIFIDLFA
jgi:hypothetical protein|nr:MAG TPA: hypothetical protein [Caudoviricetes sp.]